jgi:hypothetical protein
MEEGHSGERGCDFCIPDDHTPAAVHENTEIRCGPYDLHRIVGLGKVYDVVEGCRTCQDM